MGDDGEDASRLKCIPQNVAFAVSDHHEAPRVEVEDGID